MTLSAGAGGGRGGLRGRGRSRWVALDGFDGGLCRVELPYGARGRARRGRGRAMSGPPHPHPAAAGPSASAAALCRGVEPRTAATGAPAGVWRRLPGRARGQLAQVGAAAGAAAGAARLGGWAVPDAAAAAAAGRQQRVARVVHSGLAAGEEGSGRGAEVGRGGTPMCWSGRLRRQQQQ